MDDIIVRIEDDADLNPKLDNGTIQYGRLSIGSVTTVSPETPASVENVGTESNAILNFNIPKGNKGDKGDKGTKGDSGLVAFSLENNHLIATSESQDNLTNYDLTNGHLYLEIGE